MKEQSWEIEDLNLEGGLVLSQKYGHIQMRRVDDGTLILVGDADYGLIDQTKPTKTKFFNPDSTLGFVLDIGIQKKKILTYNSGFYHGQALVYAQSQKKISQTDFDKDLFEKIGDVVVELFQSEDEVKEIEAMRLQFLLDEYNNARLLYPNFYAESYLSLMRIIDALSDNARGSYDYATFVASVSPDLNSEVYEKITALPVFEDRITSATELFDECLKNAQQKGWSCYQTMHDFGEAEKFVYACFFSAYQYRNKFVHNGFPFPSVVMDSVGLAEDSGTAYVSPSLGQSWSRYHRPDTGLQEGDLIDVHAVVGGEEGKKFEETYFILVPTWHYLKRQTRAAILDKIETLSA